MLTLAALVLELISSLAVVLKKHQSYQHVGAIASAGAMTVFTKVSMPTWRVLTVTWWWDKKFKKRRAEDERTQYRHTGITGLCPNKQPLEIFSPVCSRATIVSVWMEKRDISKEKWYFPLHLHNCKWQSATISIFSRSEVTTRLQQHNNCTTTLLQHT